jgi:hypothetical protein
MPPSFLRANVLKTLSTDAAQLNNCAVQANGSIYVCAVLHGAALKTFSPLLPTADGIRRDRKSHASAACAKLALPSGFAL